MVNALTITHNKLHINEASLKTLKYWLIERISVALCWLFYKSYNYEWVNPELRDKAASMHPNGSFIYVLWHEYIFAGTLAHRHMNVVPLISQSKDGELIANVCEKIGFSPVRGSSSKGGTQAKAALNTQLGQGAHIALTLDGPRGPRRIPKKGVLQLAIQNDVALLPVLAIARSPWIFNSWDKFKLPKPFSKVWLAYGEPFKLQAGQDDDNLKQITNAINALEKQIIDRINQE